MARNRSRLMTDRLEDVLGGVEEEIRRAEERLQLDVFSDVGSFLGQEFNAEDSSEGVELTFSARDFATSVSSRSRGVTRRAPSPTEDPDDGSVLATLDGFERRRSRRRAWVDLESEGSPSSANSAGGGGGSGGGHQGRGSRSARGREEIVNRLLRERDARLAARSSAPQTPRGSTSERGEDSIAAVAVAEAYDPAKTIRPTRRSHDSDGIVAGVPGESCCHSTKEELGGGGGGSPSSIRGDIFFASDLLHPDDSNTDDDENQNRYAAVDPRVVGAPAAEHALLRRLRDGDAHAAADYRDVNYIELDTDKDGNDHRVSREEGGAALIRPRPPPPPLPPPPPPPPLGTIARYTPSERTSFGRSPGGGALDKGLISSPRRDSLKGRIAAGTKGRCRTKERGQSQSRSSRRGDENGATTVATARLEDQLDFRPRAKTRSSLQETSVQGNGKKKRASGERRIEELARDRQVIYSDRERRRRELQEEAETKECTFRPNIAASSAGGWGGEGGGGGYDSEGAGGRRLPLHERLHKEAREREAARALAHHHLEKEALRECTFQPTLKAAGSCTGGAAVAVARASDQRPLHQRVWEVEREREHKLRLLLADKEEREGATFAPPPLGRVSERLATRDNAWEGGGGGGRGRLASRLQEQAMWARERRRLRVQEHEEAEARMSTFEPTISRGTKSLVRKRPELQAPFEQRRAIMDAKRQERERLRQATRVEEERRWFHPATARRTEKLLRRRMPQRLEETVEERVKRMAGTDDERRRELVVAQRAKEKLECTFRPSLNPVTRSRGQAAPLDELVNNRRGQRVRERAQAKASDRVAETCSHKPVLVAEAALHTRTDGAPPRVGGGGGGRAAAAGLYGPSNRFRLSVREPARMAAELRERERKQEERFNALREEQEVSEMQRCTFVPRTNPAILRAQGPVLVRGLGRHLELKDVAQQREMERREREAQAFGVRPGAVKRTMMGETLVEPFNLSGNSKKNKRWWEERKRRHEEERAAECTFKPWTVEAERGRALSRLLDWSSVLSSE
eukprot:g5509.t1